jgi:hypothetical protein
MVTLDVLVPVLAVMGLVAPTVVVVALTTSCATVTPGVCVMPPVTEIVFPSAFVELKVDVSTPLASVDPLAGEKVLELPVDWNRIEPPEIGFPNWSSSVAVMVLAVDPTTHDVEHAVMLAVPAVSVDFTVLKGPAIPVAEKVTGFPAIPPGAAVAVSVFECDAMLSRIQLPTVATPFEPVLVDPPVTLPLVAATVKVTPTPGTPLPARSVIWTDGAVATAVFTVAD